MQSLVYEEEELIKKVQESFYGLKENIRLRKAIEKQLSRLELNLMRMKRVLLRHQKKARCIRVPTKTLNCGERVSGVNHEHCVGMVKFKCVFWKFK